jgi:hypothetical protein
MKKKFAVAACSQHQVRQLKAAGIEPIVTLMHFTLPRWSKGWTDSSTIEAFERFVRHVAPVLGPDVELWCTVNEPNVEAFSAYVAGNFPPGVPRRLRDARAAADSGGRDVQDDRRQRAPLNPPACCTAQGFTVIR